MLELSEAAELQRCTANPWWRFR